MYKISDKPSKNNALRLTNSDSFYIKCTYKDSFSEYIFGAQDFSKNFRYFMTGKSTAVFQTANQFEQFLTASERYWTEPEIISKTITKNLSKILKFIEFSKISKCYMIFNIFFIR